MSETSYQRIAREQAERQAARAKRMADAQKAMHKPRRKGSMPEDQTPFGQGDNLGESPDY